MHYTPNATDLTARNGEQERLHERARAVTDAAFGRRVFIRAVVEVSNFCRENCHYCGMRRDNQGLHRARLAADELLELLVQHRPAAVTDIMLQGGEDPVAAREIAVPLVRSLRRETSCGVSVCLGTLDRALCAELKAAGASVWVLKFETSDPQLYEQREAPGTLHQRVEQLRWLAANGWWVSSGFIVGLPGQTVESWLADCQLAARLPVRGCSASPFVPGEATPLAGASPGDVEATLNCMASLRLMRPDWVIPAVSALNIGQPGSGYRRGLRAGANLVTINLTPRDLQREYLIYKRDRFIMNEERVMAALEAEGLSPSTQGLAKFFASQPSPVIPPALIPTAH